MCMLYKSIMTVPVLLVQSFTLEGHWEGRLKGHLEDHLDGYLEDRREIRLVVRLDVRLEDHLEVRLEDPLEARLEDLQQDGVLRVQDIQVYMVGSCWELLCWEGEQRRLADSLLVDLVCWVGSHLEEGRSCCEEDIDWVAEVCQIHNYNQMCLEDSSLVGILGTEK